MDNYSSLFTMGLLSERASPVSSPRSSFFSKFRKSSLPTKALSKPSEMLYSRGEGRFYPNNDPPPQFTNPFGDSSPAATNELSSFLSLDLAADGSSTARRSSKFLSPLDTSPGTAYSSTISPRMRLSDTMAPLSAPPPRRPSRDSLRTLPSPGPAPSAALPEIPSYREPARPLPPIVIPSPSLFRVTSLSASSGDSPLVFPQPPHSAPPSSNVPSFPSPLSPTISPLSPVSPISRRTQQRSFMSFSSNTTSVRSSRRRNAERNNALACLEGVSCVPGRIPRNSRQQNFMSMSDDEDEEADTDATGADADVEDDGDAFTSLPPQPPAPRSARKSVSSFILPDSLTIGNVVTVTEIRSPIDEEEDCVLPPAAISALRQTIPSKPRARSRRSTLESWFPPLANFIDFKDDELSGWRGVVEIVNSL
ncbi:hypothetical protein V8E53_003951 [Lactarius tabidus]